MTDFVIQVGGTLPPHALDRDGSVHRHTVVVATLRDQAALYGFLKMLNDLGLDLLDLRQTPGSDEVGSLPGHYVPLMIEVVIRGSIGHLVTSALCDHAEVTHLATRLVLTDRQVLDQVLDWARQAEAPVEYVGEAPPPAWSPVTPGP
jgi:hypothetical protein